ncbi:hypothetical protein QR680_016409 [Steinernema hermaphroditum]|uniref:Uncharacterized protein n=1 Tax=Steinernema hermaphroditum TaxID=289476 RepID=A0AA39LLY4_9BILA|nr:hypothetical protein QR680_016409 [Steinernema hermaphroditum]
MSSVARTWEEIFDWDDISDRAEVPPNRLVKIEKKAFNDSDRLAIDLLEAQRQNDALVREVSANGKFNVKQ